MKRKHSIYLSVLLSLAMIFVSCDEQLDNAVDNSANNSTEQTSGGNESTEIPLPISAIVTRDGAPLSGGTFKVNTITETLDLPKGSFVIKTVKNKYPQVVWVTDENDRTLLISKGAFTENQAILINEESTALALITMAPVFSSVTNEEYTNLETAIKKSSSYGTYVVEVNKAIAAHKDLFDPANTDVLAATQAVIDEVLATPNPAGTRSGNIIKGVEDSTEPLKVTAQGNNVYVSVRGMYPSYEASIIRGGSQNVSEYKMIRTTGTFGWLEYVQERSGTTVYGEETIFNLAENGEYKFLFDRTTKKAIHDLALRLISDGFTIIGCAIEDYLDTGERIFLTIGEILIDPSSTESLQAIVNAIGNALLTEGMNLDLNKAEEKYKDNKLLSSRYKILGRIFKYYSIVKGGLGIIKRLKAYYFEDQPKQIELCLCSYNNQVTTCYTSLITKVSGDLQSAVAGRKLQAPLVVKQRTWEGDGTEISTNPFTVIRFEVILGNGHLSKEEVEVDPTTQTAETEWTLGSFGEQKVKAVIYNKLTNSEVGEPLYFTATIEIEGQDQPIPVYSECPDDHHPHLIDLGLPSGTKWACCNIGAASPEEPGDQIRWGKMIDYSQEEQVNSSEYYRANRSLMETTLDIGGTANDAAHVRWGRTWRMPTKEEFIELEEQCFVLGYNCLGDTDHPNYGMKIIGPNGNFIILPSIAASRLIYWSSSSYADQNNLGDKAWGLGGSHDIKKSEYKIQAYTFTSKYFGNYVRPVSE